MSCNPIINIPCCNDQSSSFDCGSLLFNSSDNSVLITALGDCDFNFQVNPILLVETPITPQLSNSILINVSGIDNHTLQANVRVSAMPNNILTINLDGLYVPTPSIPLIGLTNIGLGENIYASTVAGVGQLRRLRAGTNITLVSSSDDITINASSPALVETDTLATVVTRGNIVNLPITIQGLTLSAVPALGTLADNILVRDVTGVVKTILTSNFLTAEVDTLDSVTDRGAITTNILDVGGLTTLGNITGSIITGDALRLNIRTTTVNTAVLATDYTILIDTTVGNINVTYDPIIFNEKIVVVKKITNDSNIVTITPSTGTIDGSPSYSFNIENQSLTIQSNGTNLYIIAS